VKISLPPLPPHEKGDMWREEKKITPEENKG